MNILEQMDRRLILICDDSPTVLERMGYVLDKAGFLTRRYPDPRPMVAVLAIRRPAAIVLDISMPEADAFDLLSRGVIAIDIPIVFVSSKQAYLDSVRLINEKKWPDRRFVCCNKDSLRGLPNLVRSLIEGGSI